MKPQKEQQNQILIHAAGKQTRIAFLENGELAQFFIESEENQRTVGDIYLAEVHKVMSGIKAAFISMGTPKDAFLHFSDVGEHLEDYITTLNGEDAVKKAIDNNKAKNRHFKDDKGDGTEKQMRAGEVLEPGQKLLVQIVKEPIGNKGPRVSTDITIACRFVVLIPMGDYVAVSKRIRSYKERRRLKNVVSPLLPEGFGVIVRTVAENQDEASLVADMKDVLAKWSGIIEKLKTAKPPSLLYRDMDMTESLIRDHFAKDYKNIVVDETNMFNQIKTYVTRTAPQYVNNVRLFKGREHLFEHYKITQEVDSIFSPRVKMPSGGYLIFEQTEAMYVIDVNSGRYAAKKHQEDNSLKTNLEAAREIAKQLRLRDIGGIIVVDFIDLKEDVNRKKVYDELKKEFRKDRAKTNLLPMSDFGLVQITRQRIRPSVVNSVSRVCPTCGGSGIIVSENTLLADIESWLSKFKNTTKYSSVDMYLSRYMHSILTKGLFSQKVRWMFKYWLNIHVIADDTISMNDYKFTLHGSEVDITETVLAEESIEDAIKHAQDHMLDVDTSHKHDKSNLDVLESRKTGGSRRDFTNISPSDEKKLSFSDDDEDEDYETEKESKKQVHKDRRPEKKDTPKQESKPITAVKPATTTEASLAGKDVQTERVINTKGKYYKDEPVSSAPVQTTVAPVAEETTTEHVETTKDTLADVPDAFEVARAYARKKREELAAKEAEEQSNPSAATQVEAPVSSQHETAETPATTEEENQTEVTPSPAAKVKRSNRKQPDTTEETSEQAEPVETKDDAETAEITEAEEKPKRRGRPKKAEKTAEAKPKSGGRKKAGKKADTEEAPVAEAPSTETTESGASKKGGLKVSTRKASAKSDEKTDDGGADE